MIAVSKRSPISARRLQSLPKSNGIHAVFVPLSKNRGAKLFETQWRRDENAQFQAKLAKYGLAPRVFRLFQVKIARKVWHGYVTERARLEVSNVNPSFAFTHSGNYTNYGIRGEHKHAYPLVYVEQLKAALAALDIQWPDCHAGNLGYLGKKLVIIDCDPDYFAIGHKSPLSDGCCDSEEETI